eukprot:1418766-Rhodomonas_salina.2
MVPRKEFCLEFVVVVLVGRSDGDDGAMSCHAERKGSIMIRMGVVLMVVMMAMLVMRMTMMTTMTRMMTMTMPMKVRKTTRTPTLTMKLMRHCCADAQS